MPKQDTILNVVLMTVGVCAIVLTGAVLGRGSDRGQYKSPVEFVRLSNWTEYGAVGNRMGPRDAKVVVVEFSDFQCPFCRAMAKDLRVLRSRYPREVAIVFRHFPIEQLHPFASVAAAAAECAGESGGFEGLHDALFSDSVELAKVEWTRLALAAGVRDTSAFTACMASGRGAKGVARDLLAARALNVDRTPTILINQYRIVGAPRLELMDSLVRVSLRE